MSKESIEADIAANYERYAAEDQTRDERGQLQDPVAATFEVRMNRSLDQLRDLQKYAGTVVPETVILGTE